MVFHFQLQLFKTCLVFRFPEFLIHASRLAKGYPSPMKKVRRGGRYSRGTVKCIFILAIISNTEKIA